MKKLITTITVILIAATVCWWWLLPPSQPDEVIFHGGPIVTLDETTPNPEALFVKSGRIAAMGSLSSVQSVASRDTKLIDLAGRTLLPGFIEPHTHPLGSAILGAAIDVSGFIHSNRSDVLDSLKSGIENGGVNGWIIATGWDPVMLDDLSPPTLEELDTLSPDKPLVILTQMMHDAYANSIALQAAGISNSSIAPPGGEYVRDAAGQLTGTIREIPALNVLLGALPAPPPGAHEFLLAQQYKKYAKSGYTTVGILGPLSRAKSPLTTIRQVGNSDDVPIRSVIYALPDQISPDLPPEPSTHNAAVIGVKFWMDGSPFAGGAAFEDPYENNHLTQGRLHLKRNHFGALNYDLGAFEKLFGSYHKRGFQIAVHTQGERAVERALSVIESTLQNHPRPDHRHRLEHNALITEEQLEKAHQLGVTTSFFTNHLYYYGHALDKLVGERTNRYMPIKSALKTGHRATIHTDNPASPIDALQAMQTAVMRESRFGNHILAPDQKLTRLQALRAMTVDAAWQLGLEDETGSLTVGKSADFVILSDNPLATIDEKIGDIRVHETWLRGQPVDTRPINSLAFRFGFGILKGLLTEVRQ